MKALFSPVTESEVKVTKITASAFLQYVGFTSGTALTWDIWRGEGLHFFGKAESRCCGALPICVLWLVPSAVRKWSPLPTFAAEHSPGAKQARGCNLQVSQQPAHQPSASV